MEGYGQGEGASPEQVSFTWLRVNPQQGCIKLDWTKHGVHFSTGDQ